MRKVVGSIFSQGKVYLNGFLLSYYISVQMWSQKPGSYPAVRGYAEAKTRKLSPAVSSLFSAPQVQVTDALKLLSRFSVLYYFSFVDARGNFKRLLNDRSTGLSCTPSSTRVQNINRIRPVLPSCRAASKIIWYTRGYTSVWQSRNLCRMYTNHRFKICSIFNSV